jgi:hypothetical protein
LLLRGIRQRNAGQIAVLMKPVVDIQNLLRIRRGRRNLRNQRVRIQSDRSQQLIQFLCGRRCDLGIKNSFGILEQQENSQRDCSRRAIVPAQHSPHDFD